MLTAFRLRGARNPYTCNEWRGDQSCGHIDNLGSAALSRCLTRGLHDAQFGRLAVRCVEPQRVRPHALADGNLVHGLLSSGRVVRGHIVEQRLVQRRRLSVLLTRHVGRWEAELSVPFGEVGIGQSRLRVRHEGIGEALRITQISKG